MKGAGPGAGAGQRPWSRRLLRCEDLAWPPLEGGWQGAAVWRVESKTASKPCGEGRLDHGPEAGHDAEEVTALGCACLGV